ncbi:MAG: HEAT repeat domain-containing protein [Phycisphaeraceae bacterium]|nr:MAG: HEAT repeat domain-containing protein [Phycisphaeraceae bacterium]
MTEHPAPQRESHPRRRVWLVALAAVVAIPTLYALLIGGSLWTRRGGTNRPTPVSITAEATFVGGAACRSCHAAEYDAWNGSQHDLAMQPATEATVLGDFDDASFEQDGSTTRFVRRGDDFMIEADVVDNNGASSRREYKVAYTFGVFPLQQYLIAFPGGRYQSLTIAWDSRQAEQGGQRWFDLYPDESTPPGDELHWASPAHNWNYTCADCHSTNLEKNYGAESDTFDTTWTDIDVSCEACHGPGSRHVALAQAAAEDAGKGGDANAAYSASGGLIVHPRGPGEWTLAPGAKFAVPTRLAEGDSEIEMCGQCHARRTQFAPNAPGRPLDETHTVELLRDGLYFADGQIEDEVYVYGSFRQSKMEAMGVTCSDCHDPHTAKIRVGGNALCTRCHAATVYDTPDHHFHEPGTESASCVACHMPTRTYMVVDPRRDHSMRIPRPDLTVELGVPNACTSCHDDQTPQWALDAVVKWYGENRIPGFQRYAHTLHDARVGAPGSTAALEALANDADAPGIARATALAELGEVLSPAGLPTVRAQLASPDPLIRRAAASSLAYADQGTRWRMLRPALGDKAPAVRLAAATNLLDVRPDDVEEAARPVLRGALDEYIAAQRFNADRAESWVNLARYHAAQGDADEAIRDYAQARRLNRLFEPIYANEADLCRSLGREDEGERVLREGLAVKPGSAILHHSLGLLLVRTQRHQEALRELEQAATLAPESARFGYVYGVALESLKSEADAIAAWEQVIGNHPNDRDTLHALAVALAQEGEPRKALPYAERLQALEPHDAGVAQMVEAIRQMSD